MTRDFLKKTVPFVSCSTVSPSKIVCLVDHVEVPLKAIDTGLTEKLGSSITLPESRMIGASTAIDLVHQQLDSCLEHAFSDDYWRLLRDTSPDRDVSAYILENMHYLKAAPYRMAQGVGRSLMLNPLLDHIAAHTVEEAGHSIYFEKALHHLGCPQDILTRVHPMPVTLEWIYLMRAVSRLDPLSAALCSGLLEHTVQNQTCVESWHDMLVCTKVLPKVSVDAIREHIRIDKDLGHGNNWIKAIELENFIDPKCLVQALNATTLVAEMMSRWFSSLRTGLSRYVVQLIPSLCENKRQNLTRGSWPFPVLSSELLHQAVHGELKGNGSRSVVAITAAFRGSLNEDAQTDKVSCRYVKRSRLLLERTGALGSFSNDVHGSFHYIKSWLRVVDGHRLWKAMIERGDYALVCGWILENYHYIGFIAQHGAAAIGSCTDPVIRGHLIKHLGEELYHSELLFKVLQTSKYGDITSYRPLATTVSFLGALRDLAREDWRAYCLSLIFLQLTLKSKSDDHDRFYTIVSARCPEASDLLEAMKSHDTVDVKLCHEDDMFQLLRDVIARHDINEETYQAASIIPQLLWSFCDGIRCHYQHGDPSVLSRIGWSIS